MHRGRLMISSQHNNETSSSPINPSYNGSRASNVTIFTSNNSGLDKNKP